MKKLKYKVDIKAPIAKVYAIMLGLGNKSTYDAWTAEFNPTSTYEGSWERGSKIYFIGTDENGEKGGMVAEIIENIPNKFVSIRTLGFLKGTIEITTGEEVIKWSGGLENYFFEEHNGMTTITVEVDIIEDYIEHFNTTYPKALNKLKEIIEN